MNNTRKFFWIIALLTAIGLTFIACEGPTGLQGDPGLGTHGETPHIGENGNWWIGEKDTGFWAGPPQGFKAIEIAFPPNITVFPEGAYIDTTFPGLRINVIDAHGLVWRKTDFRLEYDEDMSQTGDFTVTVISNWNDALTASFTITVEPAATPYAGRLLILQAGAAGSNGAIGRSFVELFNNSDDPIDLSTFSLHVANGQTGNNAWPQYAVAGGSWTRIDLNGTIGAKHSFLVVFNTVGNPANQRFTFTDEQADIAVPASVFPALSNRSFKVALMANQNNLTVVNPFTGGSGERPVAGFVDLLGAVNEFPGDTIHAYAGQFAGATAQVLSQQASARRITLTNTNNNNNDFERIHFGNVSATVFERVRPRTSSDGAWDPMTGEEVDPPIHTGPYAGRLLILQAGAAGSNGAIGRSFVELFNNSDAPINLNTFSLHVANGRSGNAAWPQYAVEGGPWIRIDLDGTIGARRSFLVVFNTVGNTANQRFTFTDEQADQVVPYVVLSNRSFQVALLSNRQDLSPRSNPFTGNAEAPIDGFVDLLGAVNTPGPYEYVNAYEGLAAGVISQQASARRINLTDTNNNDADFGRVDFRYIPGEGTPNNAGGTSIADFGRVRPRTSSDGAWNPMTGQNE